MPGRSKRVERCHAHGVSYRGRCPRCEEGPIEAETRRLRMAALASPGDGLVRVGPDLPRPTARPCFEAPYLAMLRDDPGIWYELPSPSKYRSAYALKARERNRGFEFAVRGGRILARFVGEGRRP